MPRDRRDVETGLLAKGFRRKEGDHHFFLYHTLAGLKSQVFTKTSHNQKQINDHLLGLTARQCRLTSKLFANLLDCPLDQTGFEAELRKQNVIRQHPGGEVYSKRKFDLKRVLICPPLCWTRGDSASLRGPIVAARKVAKTQL